MSARFFAPKLPLTDVVKRKIVSDVIDRLQQASPQKAIMFGSFADGTAHADSDIDILVICKDVLDIKKVRNSVYSNLKGPITDVPVDFIFVTEDDFELRKRIGGVCLIANAEGKIIVENSE